MLLEDLEIYAIARELNKGAWDVHEKLDWRDKKIIGDQFISSTDSIGANIAEGFGRYHYLDKNKFYYNARGSLLESGYWLAVLKERGKINDEAFTSLKTKLDKLHKKLNSFINATRDQKSNS